MKLNKPFYDICLNLSIHTTKIIAIGAHDFYDQWCCVHSTERSSQLGDTYSLSYVHNCHNFLPWLKYMMYLFACHHHLRLY